MPRKGQFSDRYSAFNRTSITFDSPPAVSVPCSQGADIPPPAPWLHGTLTADGVAGAAPRAYDRFTRKGPHVQSTLAKVFADVPGMQPRQFTPKQPRNVPDLKLDISDIEGAHPDPKGWHFHTPRGTNPLDPQYKLPTAPEEPAPAPRFLRDTLDISDIEGAKAKPDVRAQRALRSLDVADIPGAQPGWKPTPAQARRPGAAGRNPLDVSDICMNDPSPQQKHLQLVGGARSPVPAAGQQGGSPGSSGSPARTARPWVPASSPAGASERLNDVGVIKNVDWRRQQYAAVREQGEALRVARAEAEGAVEARAQQIASASALSGLLRGFRAFDKDRSGRVQAGEFASVLERAGLGLSHEEVSKLVGGLKDGNNVVEYKSFMGRLFNRVQQARKEEAPAQQSVACSGPQLRRGSGYSLSPRRAGVQGRGAQQQQDGGAVGEELRLPDWAAARRRRLSTAVAVTLNQQPVATAAEAASLATPQPWHFKSPRRFTQHTKANPTAPERLGGMRPASCATAEAAQAGRVGSLREIGDSAEPAARCGNRMVTAPPQLGSTPEIHSRGGEQAADNCPWEKDTPAVAHTSRAIRTAPTGKPGSWTRSRACTPWGPAASQQWEHSGGSSRDGDAPHLPTSRHISTPPAPRLVVESPKSAMPSLRLSPSLGSPGRVLPQLLQPTASQSVHGTGAMCMDREMAAERACRVQAAEDVALVRGLELGPASL